MGIHIVGLNIDVKSPTLKEAITYQVNVREMRAQTIAERLEKKLDITGVLEGAAHCAQGNTIGRPHFAQYLVKRGYTSSVNEAFKKYLGAGKIGDVKQGWPSLETVVKWIIDSHGIAVLAHPTKYELTRNKMYQLMECFKNAGGQAVEVVSGKQDAKNTAILSKAADDFSFYASCGSDFHALGQPWQSLGEHTSMPENCKPVWQLF